MSRLYDALRRAESPANGSGQASAQPARAADLLKNIVDGATEAETPVTRSASLKISSCPRLVSFSDPKSLAAEKFRALATRLGHIRSQRELKSLMITSAGIGEGKSLVAANLAVTLATYTKARVLLIDGDLHRPSIGSMFGAGNVKGLADWWADRTQPIDQYLHKLNEMSLWFLSAGTPRDVSSELLQSENLASAMTAFQSQYDWIVVDSTPMSPIVDANLWTRLVDGTLLVVRERVALVHALKKGLESLDTPKLIGIVLNDASERADEYSKYSYYGK
jgi:capsular exopolysaccharide synthesis family protein